MPKLLRLVLRDILVAFTGSMLAWLALSFGLGFIWLDRPLGLSLSHWAPSFIGSFLGIAFVNASRTFVLCRSEGIGTKKPEFECLAPQKVRNVALGYIVQSADRHHVEYVESTRSALVEVEHGRVIAIYADSLTHWESKDGTIEMSVDDREMVLSRISLGLRAMDCECELL